MKHTEGSWTIKPSPSESSSGWTAIECNDEVIAEVYGSDEESQTLASLIAAAPEMLELLKKCYTGEIEEPYNNDELNAFISKAEGK